MVRPGPCPGWGRRSLQRRSCSPYGRSCGGRDGPCRNRKASFPSPLQRRSAASFKAPGVAGGLMIVLVGFANGNRLLAGLGIAALLYYVSSYYYLLDATLLAKAGVLAASGVVLLGARWLLLNVVMPERAYADA